MTPRSLVDATGTRRRLEALAAIGWPATRIGWHLRRPHASSRALVSSWRHRGRRVIATTTATDVTHVYLALKDTPGPDPTVRIQALRAGCLPPQAWDGLDIDDPNTQPHQPDADDEDDRAA